jgi:hypothetical protein
MIPISYEQAWGTPPCGLRAMLECARRRRALGVGMSVGIPDFPR